MAEHHDVQPSNSVIGRSSGNGKGRLFCLRYWKKHLNGKKRTEYRSGFRHFRGSDMAYDKVRGHTLCPGPQIWDFSIGHLPSEQHNYIHDA